MDAARKAKLGQKWVCFACSSKFYDMAREAPVCPKCGKDQREAPVVLPKPRARKGGRAKAVEEVVAAPLEEERTSRRRMDEGADEVEDLEDDLDDLGDLDDDLDLSADDSGDGDEFEIDEEAAS